MLRLFLFFFLCTQGLLAQNTQWSELFTREQTNRAEALLHEDSDGYTVLRYSDDFQYGEIEQLDTALQKRTSKMLFDLKKNRYIGLLEMKDRYWLLYSIWEQLPMNENAEVETTPDRKVGIYALALEPGSFRLSKDSVVLMPVQTISADIFEVDIALSPDKSKLLLYSYTAENKYGDITNLSDYLRLQVWNADLQPLWEREVNLAPKEADKKRVAIKKAAVDNQAQVVVLTDVFRDIRSYRGKTVTADPNLYFVGPQKEQFGRYQPDFGDYFYNQMDFTFDESGQLYWVGFYSNRRYHLQDGLFFVKINAERNKVLFKTRQPFGDSLKAKMLSDKQVERGVELRNFEMRHLLLDSEGRLSISAEQHTGNSIRDILLFRLKPDGFVDWAHHFPQLGGYPPRELLFRRHYIFQRGDTVHLLYNQGTYGPDQLRHCWIAPNGRLSTVDLWDNQKAGGVLAPERIRPLTDGRLFFILQSRFFKYYRYVIWDPASTTSRLED